MFNLNMLKTKFARRCKNSGLKISGNIDLHMSAL